MAWRESGVYRRRHSVSARPRAAVETDTKEVILMKAVILAGGFGTRLAEETDLRPKPMIEIGGKPILWHIMRLYSHYGVRDFVICCGYKAEWIKRYFSEYYTINSDITVNLANGSIDYINPIKEDWRVTLVDTGLETMTGGRLKRVRHHVAGETFCMTYGDGLADIDISQTIAFHKRHGRLATLTAVPSPGRFGIIDIQGEEKVTRFHEKPDNEMGWINGGFFVLEPAALDVVEGDTTIWERQPLEQLAQAGELRAYRHERFWRPVDTLRDKRELEAMWARGEAPWKR